MPRARLHRTVCTVAIVVLALASGVARAEDVRALETAVHDAMASAAAAAFHVVEDDGPGAVADLNAAIASAGQARTLAADPGVVAELGKKAKGVAKKAGKFVTKLETARAAAALGEPDDSKTVKAIRKAAKAGAGIQKVTRKLTARDVAVHIGKSGSLAFKGRGKRVKLTVFLGTEPGGALCTDAQVVVRQAVPGSPLVGVLPGVVDLGGGRYQVTLGPDLGGAVVEVTSCGVTRTAQVFNWGARKALKTDPPAGLGYGGDPLFVHAGRPMAPVNPVVGGGSVDGFMVAPALPAGLSMDTETGEISGTPQTESPQAVFVVTAFNRRGSTTADFTIGIGAALPPQVLELERGFVIEALHTGLAEPVKMALAPDGRLFFNELGGRVRVIDAQGNLLAQPFATEAVRAQGERGLLGLALAPDFATSGHVFVYATIAGATPAQDENQVIRYTASGSNGTARTVIVAGIPAAAEHNAGDIQFGPDGKLYVSVGDTSDPDLSQTDSVLPGKILRYEPDGTPAAGNPRPGEAEWCRGLRNSFDMTFHPTTGGLFASENGPMSDDEVNLIVAGKNYEWGAPPDTLSGAVIGLRIIDWTPVIAPTGITFHSGTAFGAEYANNLFVCGYADADLRRVVLSGGSFTDVDEQVPFARFSLEVGFGNIPVDILEAPDGALLVSTFDTIWRISPE